MEDNEFLEDIIVTAVEGGMNYWALVLNYDGKSAVIIDENEDYPDELEVTPAKISKALAKIIGNQTGIASEYCNIIAKAAQERDAGMIDAMLADCIVQVAVFGDAIYS